MKLKYTLDLVLPTAFELDSDLHTIICIPCFCELEVEKTIESISKCIKSEYKVQLLILINDGYQCSMDQKQVNEHVYQNLLQSHEANNATLDNGVRLEFYYVRDLPSKNCGVGLVRKILMEEAYRRLMAINNPDGIIVCLDADCLVQENYLLALEQSFVDPKIKSASIHFEHLKSEDEEINKAIIDYELHLRVYLNFQRLIGLPYAFHTVGSAMAVRAESYQKEGGMNKRQAGEDFYFLQKFIKKGTHIDIGSTTVFPSPRRSDRVPFGTGKAVNDTLSGEKILTYNFKSFEVLKDFTSRLEALYKGESFLSMDLRPEVLNFLVMSGFEKRLEEIRSNTSNFSSFKKRFFYWFDAFRLMKYLHFLRVYPDYHDIEISQAVEFLFRNLGIESSLSKFEDLKALRNYDKSIYYMYK